MIRRYATATVLAAGLAFSAVNPAIADTATDETTVSTTADDSTSGTETNDSSAYPANGGSSDSSDSAQAFSSEIKPADVSNVFGNIVDLVGAILGFVAKVA